MLLKDSNSYLTQQPLETHPLVRAPQRLLDSDLPGYQHGSEDCTLKNRALRSKPVRGQVRSFSNELQVTKDTPPTLILQATDDDLVDVDNSIVFFEALRHAKVPVDMTLFRKGEHGSFCCRGTNGRS